MLGKLLSKAECAKCQICCTFDDDDIWETPVITQRNIKEIENSDLPIELKLTPVKNYLTISAEKETDDILYYCTMLDRASGCRLGDSKPFDCKIWPFRVMKLDQRLVITLSPVCPSVKQNSLVKIQERVDEIKDEIFSYAQANPYAVKDYIDGYPILAVKF